MTAGAIASAPASPFAVFRNRSFAWMWSGQLISTIGSALTSLAASIYVYRATGSAASVGLMLMATAAPSLVVGLIAGVFVDRFDRRRIMIVADLIRAVLVFSIPFLVPLNIAWLYIIVALSSAVGQFFDPAHESVLPEVASEQELAAANSLMAISSFGATAVGFAASGLIAAAADIRWAFYLDSLTFFFSALCILMLRIKPLAVQEIATPQEPGAGVRMVLRNVQTGVRFLIDTPILRSLFTVLVPVFVAFGLSNALLLPFASRALGANEFQYGIQEGMTSLGFVAGALLMAGLFDRMREGPWIATSFIGMGLMGILYSQATTVPVAIVILTISGFLNSPSSIGRRLVIQRNTPREMRGRVNSAFFVSRDILFIIGMAAAGLADLIDVRIMYLISALMVLGGGIWVLFLPGLRQEAAEWRRALGLLHTAPVAPGLGVGRPASPADFDALAGLLPPLATLSAEERASLVGQSCVFQAPMGTAIVKHGEAGDSAYFILAGRVVAGIATAEGGYRSLSTMAAGDFFGEIAALTGARRTADVVVENPAGSTLLQVPAGVLRELMDNPSLNRIFASKMTERLARTNITELPRFAGVDQEALKELRVEAAEGTATVAGAAD
jgi:CRP-like cAMP-binding protein/Na+/melibiose symporter-like transporter